MKFKGIADEADRTELIRYLGSLGSETVIKAVAETVTETVAVAEVKAEIIKTAGTSEAPKASEDLASLIAKADINIGLTLFKTCKTCHTIDEGGLHKIGPNLWDIIGRKQASAEGYKFSGVMRNLKGTWSYEELSKFLTNPADYAPGTKMRFRGFSKANVRAALLRYLRAQSNSPAPLP
jgi:cytochrome c